MYCRGCGTLIVPKWKSANFWPFLFKNNLETHRYVREILEFDADQKIFEQGLNKNSIFGSDSFSSPVLAVRFDMSNV